MLDFYLIQDQQIKPDYPEQAKLKFAGGIESNTFTLLVKKGIIDSKYNYYSDFRWTNDEVHQITKRAIAQADTTSEKLILILNQAINSNTGLIAYCD